MFRRIFLKQIFEQMPWLTPVILAAWEVEIRRIAIQHQMGKKVHNTPCQPAMDNGSRSEPEQNARPCLKNNQSSTVLA
jgi:hypothetical protein